MVGTKVSKYFRLIKMKKFEFAMRKQKEEETEDKSNQNTAKKTLALEMGEGIKGRWMLDERLKARLK